MLVARQADDDAFLNVPELIDLIRTTHRKTAAEGAADDADAAATLSDALTRLGSTATALGATGAAARAAMRPRSVPWMLGRFGGVICLQGAVQL